MESYNLKKKNIKIKYFRMSLYVPIDGWTSDDSIFCNCFAENISKCIHSSIIFLLLKHSLVTACPPSNNITIRFCSTVLYLWMYFVLAKRLYRCSGRSAENFFFFFSFFNPTIFTNFPNIATEIQTHFIWIARTNN